MSADNYYRIFREGDTFYVLMGFASDDEDGRVLRVRDQDRQQGGFDNINDAIEFCQSQYAEYGWDFDSSALDVEEPRWKWDGEVNMGYLRVGLPRAVERTVMLRGGNSDRINVGYDAAGNVVVVEVFG